MDQRARHGLFAEARARNIGVIIKRPLANGMWGKDRAVYANLGPYVERVQAMERAGPVSGGAPDDPIALSLGFVLAHLEVDAALVGTNNLSHLRSNIEVVENGLSLAAEVVDELHRRFEELDAGWLQLL